MGKESLVFFLSGRFDEKAIEGVLKNHWNLTIGESSKRLFHILDCHDQFLVSKGKLLIETDGKLHLFSFKRHVTQQGSGAGQFVQNLPNGAVRSGLSKFPTLRALIPIASGTVKERKLSVLDDFRKTRVQGQVVDLVSDHGRATIVVLCQVNGPSSSFKNIRKSIEKNKDIRNATGVFTALSPDTPRYLAKPDIPLARAEPTVDVATKIIGTYLAVARQNENGVIADYDTEFLHDYRVSLRRIRSVLSLFKGVFSPHQTMGLKRTFSDLMAPTNRLRDLDVYLLEKNNYYSMIPENLHVGAEIMFAQFEAERKRSWKVLSQKFRSVSYNRCMLELSRQITDPKSVQTGPNAELAAYDFACTMIWKRYRKLCRRARRIMPNSPDTLVHDLRIEGKKLRYLMEFFGPLFNQKSLNTILKPLKKLQDNLGRFNDFSVQQKALLELVDRQVETKQPEIAQIALSAGGVITVLKQRQEAERQRVIAHLRGLDNPEIKHQYRRLFQ